MTSDQAQCVASRGTERCDAPIAIVTPVALCETHRLQIALDAAPEAIARVLGIRPSEDQPALIRSADRADLIEHARPAVFGSEISGRHEPIVYFLANGGRVKIGYSCCLGSRLRALAAKRDQVVVMLKGGKRLEGSLHKRFAQHRLSDTEWFDLAPEIIRYIGSRMVKTSHTIQPRSDVPGEELPLSDSHPLVQRQEEARAQLEDAIAAIGDSGVATVGPRDVMSGYRAQISRSRAWVSAEMSRLADRGVLARTDQPGIYTFRPYS